MVFVDSEIGSEIELFDDDFEIFDCFMEEEEIYNK